jgi:hypothetical protein
MSKLNLKPQLLIAALLLVVLITGRLVPHAANFTPVLAIALFAGSFYPKYLSTIIVVAALIVSDIVLGFTWITPVVYLTILLITLGGGALRKKLEQTRLFKKVVLLSMGGGIVFFLVTNFAVWAFGMGYVHNMAGLIHCYVEGIPFFRNTLLSTLLYSSVLFGMAASVQRRYKTVTA